MFGFHDASRIGTELWPRQAMVPPRIRIEFEEPPRNPATYGTIITVSGGAYSVELALNELLATMPDKEVEDFTERMKRAALERAMPRFIQWATGLRDNIDRPGITGIIHKQLVDDTAIMDYYSHNNTSSLDVRIKYDAWVKMAVKLAGDDDELCMFIFHSGNRITAVPMSCFKDGRFFALAEYKQLYNGWGSERIKATQMRFSQDFSVLLTPLTRVPQDRDYVFRPQKNYHVVGVASEDADEDTWEDSARTYEDALVPKEELPVLNGSADRFYTLMSTGSINSRDYRPTVQKVSIDVSPGKPFGVTNTGQLISGQLVYSSYMHLSFVFAPYDSDDTDKLNPINKGGPSISSDYALVPERAADKIDEELSQLPQIGNGRYPSILTIGTLCRDGEVEYDYTYGSDEYMAKSSMSTQGVKPIHTVSGGRDNLEYRTVNSSVRVEWVESTAAYYDALDWTYENYREHLDSRGKNKAEYMQVMWPPSTFGRTSMSMKTGDNVVETPYGKFNKIEPWLHISNGKYYIQGIVGDSTPMIWYGGSSFGEKLSSLAKTSIEKIQCVYFDMPLSLLFPEEFD